MDFSWAPIQQELYDQTLGFARERLNHGVRERLQTHAFDRARWAELGAQGLTGLCIPEAYGGMGLDALTTARAIEALGRGCEDLGLVFSLSAHLFAVAMPLVEFGSDSAREYFLPRLASGEWIGANAITEGEAGSDAFALKTRATKTEGGYSLTGAKSYTTNGPVGDVFLTYATINPSYGYLGITAFAVERSAVGITIGQPFGKLGLTTSPTSSVYFDNCHVPSAYRLGRDGQGGHIFRRSMGWERACLFAAYVGMMDRQLEQTIVYARERKQFGKPIGKNQAISHRIADMKLRLEASRLLLYQACWQMAQGKEAVLEVSLSKLAISQAAIQSSLDAIQIHGGIGVSTEFNLESMLRDAVPSTIFSGTSEIQRDLIARELGL